MGAIEDIYIFTYNSFPAYCLFIQLLEPAISPAVKYKISLQKIRLFSVSLWGHFHDFNI